jgi:biotin carboxyl carrier protein
VVALKFAAKVGGTVREVVISRLDGNYLVTLDGKEHLVDARKLEADFYSILYEGKSYEVAVEASGSRYLVRYGAHEQVVELADASRGGRDEIARKGGPVEIDATMPGKIVRVLVAAGDEVVLGQGLVVVEAMKMENEIAAPRAGRVIELSVAPGQTVEAGAKLILLG